MNKSNLTYIDSMRGIAILMVLIVHSTQFFQSVGIEYLPFHLEKVLYSGKYGVVLFFIVSAFTLFRSLDIRKEDGFKNYYIRRFFRIAPLYYLVLIIIFCLSSGQQYYMVEPEHSISSYNLLTHVLFINGFFTNYFNSMIGVEWTIFVEVLFYLTLPLLFVYKKYLLQITIILFLTSLLGFLTIELVSNHLLKIQIMFSPITYFVIFAYGALIYQYRDKAFLKRIFINYKNLLSIILVVLFILFSYVGGAITFFIFGFLLGVFFLLVEYNNFALFNSFFLRKIGELSFSIYLIHFPIILYIRNNTKINIFGNDIVNYLFLCTLAFVIIIAISIFTYRFVEQPFIKLGKKYIKRGLNKK